MRIYDANLRMKYESTDMRMKKWYEWCEWRCEWCE